MLTVYTVALARVVHGHTHKVVNRVKTLTKPHSRRNSSLGKAQKWQHKELSIEEGTNVGGHKELSTGEGTNVGGHQELSTREGTNVGGHKELSNEEGTKCWWAQRTLYWGRYKRGGIRDSSAISDLVSVRKITTHSGSGLINHRIYG